MSLRRVLLPLATALCLVATTAACGPAESGQFAEAAAEQAPTASPTPSPSPSPTPSPVVEVKRITVAEKIAFKRTTVKDASLPEGTRKVRTKGVDGVRTKTFEVTLTDGKETARKLLRDVVTKKAVNEVVAVGTKKTRQCDPNYSGCVPIASDVDCAGGGGNGPAYVNGPVRVIGDDVYDLDRDGDGTACD